MTYSHIGEQSRRIAGCGLRIVPASDQSEALALLAREVNGFIESFELDSEDGKTEVVSPEGVVFAPTFPKRTRLDPGFFDYVSASRVALDRVAIQQISDNGWALDLYIWLATELPALAAPLQISWPMFFEGFGDQGPRHRIKAKALSTLPLVAAVYPDARIRVDQDGLLLLPSPPAMFA